jgi:hypothetical protein
MIRYDLTCPSDHRFDSWFSNAAGFDTQKAAGQVACPTCGSTVIEKALMAPNVATAHTRPMTTPRDGREAALAALREKVEQGSDYVGMNFVAEARAIHAGDAPERSIYGEAKPEEARALIEDGVPVTPLPFMPTRKTN